MKPEVLQPASAAAKFHSMQVYLQVQHWTYALNGEQNEWGWSEKGREYIPVLTDKEAAPKVLLKIIGCKCKMVCSNMLFICIANGLECAHGCEVCRDE